MADDRAPRQSRPAGSGGRSDGARSGGRPSGGRPSGGPTRGTGGTGRSASADKPWVKRGDDDNKKPYSKRDGDKKPWPKKDDSSRGGSRPYSRDRRDDDRRPARTEIERTAEQAKYDGPEIAEWITGKELDRSVADQLKSLPEKLMLRVARHLVAAGELLESDPKIAYQHTLAARGRAGRLAVVREAVGEAAYAAGEYSEALAELRSAKRMNGAHDYVAIMADCERALGRPDRALTLLKNTPRDKFAPPLLAEVLIVEAGARRDRGEIDAALRTLENGNLNSKSRAPWVARMRYAYAETLLAAKRPEDALEWFHRTEAVDVDEITDAGARALEVERSLPKA